MIEAKLPLEVHSRAQRVGMPVEDADCLRTIRQRPYPYFNRAGSADTISLSSGTVLIYSNDVFVRKQRDGLRRHRGEIVARKEWRSENRPQTHVRPILIHVHAAIAHLEHVGAVPMSWSAKTRQTSLATANRLHMHVRL